MDAASAPLDGPGKGNDRRGDGHDQFTPTNGKDPVGATLFHNGAISAELCRRSELQLGDRDPIATAYQRFQELPEATVARAIASHLTIPFHDLKGQVAKSLAGEVSRELATRWGVVPLGAKNEILTLGVSNPGQFLASVADITFVLGDKARFVFIAPTAFTAAFHRLYDRSDLIKVLTGKQEEGPVPRLVHSLIVEAVKRRASDLYVEPGEHSLRIRYRVDGICTVGQELEAHLTPNVISRFKVLADMNIGEHRRPQDGHIGLEVGGRPIDIRVSVLPGVRGETMTLRILDREGGIKPLNETGFDRESLEWFQRMISRPNGMILVTGPTGSGKTTTLYGVLCQLNRPDIKIVTVEDPVEYQIGGIDQIQVKPEIDLTFAKVLRNIVRSAPDVILVGEIRDAETADIALQAALTGHRVFSTLHTSSSVGAVSRLLALGAEPFLVAATMHGVVSQRLMRQLCGNCATSYTPSAEEAALLKIKQDDPAPHALRKACGCSICSGTGYSGRIGVFEIFEMNRELADLVLKSGSQGEIEERALAKGLLRPIEHDAKRKVAAGVTSIEEFHRMFGI